MEHVGEFPNQFPNVPGTPAQVSGTYGFTDSYENYKLSFAAEIGDKWTVMVYGENLSDDDSTTYIHPEAFLDSRYGTLRPRTYGIRAVYTY